MKKRNIILLLLLTVILSLLCQVFFGSYLNARISTLAFVRKFDLLRPEAPIVIHTTEEVHVSDSEDVLIAYNKAKSKISTLLQIEGDTVKAIASAINISGDGLFVVPKAGIVGIPVEKMAIRLFNGEVAKVSSVVFDPSINIAVVAAPLKNVAPVSFADSINATPGQRVVLVAGDNTKNPNFLSSFVSLEERITGTVSADYTSRQFTIQQTGGLQSGHVVVNLDGEVLGLWDGGTVIPADVLKHSSTLFFSTNKSFKRPLFGFSYRFITETEASLILLPSGAQVVKAGDAGLTVGGPAEKGGLKLGDIITEINGTKLVDSVQLETVLEKVAPGDTVAMSVQRGSSTVTLNVQSGELK